MFFDTIENFQQSLWALATDSEKSAIRTDCKKFINKGENLSKKFNTCTEEDQGGCLITYQQENRQFHMK